MNNADCAFTGFTVSATVTWAAGDPKVCGIDVQVWSGGANKTGRNQLQVLQSPPDGTYSIGGQASAVLGAVQPPVAGEVRYDILDFFGAQIKDAQGMPIYKSIPITLVP